MKSLKVLKVLNFLTIGFLGTYSQCTLLYFEIEQFSKVFSKIYKIFFSQGFVEFRYNLGSGPAILRSLSKVIWLTLCQFFLFLDALASLDFTLVSK